MKVLCFAKDIIQSSFPNYHIVVLQHNDVMDVLSLPQDKRTNSCLFLLVVNEQNKRRKSELWVCVDRKQLCREHGGITLPSWLLWPPGAVCHAEEFALDCAVIQLHKDALLCPFPCEFPNQVYLKCYFKSYVYKWAGLHCAMLTNALSSFFPKHFAQCIAQTKCFRRCILFCFLQCLLIIII